MKCYSLTHLGNEVLDRELPAKAARSREVTAELLAYIAEFDERKRYLPAAYESMLAYCIDELRLSKDEAKQRIHIARACRVCPGAFRALEEGQIHLTGLRLLAPHLTPENADELLAAAALKSKEEIERLLATRVPRLDVPAMVAPVVVEGAPEHLGNTDSQGPTCFPAVRPRARVSPLSAESFAVQFTRSREADERFRHAQDLLGHRVPRHDIAEVYSRAVNALVEKLERERFGGGAKSRKGGRRLKSGSRHVPFDVKRAVWIRDRAAAKAAREQARAEKVAEAERARLRPHQLEVLPWLLELGCSKDQSRVAVERCRDMADAPLEDRVKRALSWFGARIGRKVMPIAPAAS